MTPALVAILVFPVSVLTAGEDDFPCREGRSCGSDYEGCGSCGSIYEGCGSGSQQSPWTGSLTQTVDYGTNLTLPIGLTPANTLLAPTGGLGGTIFNDRLLGGLGLLDNLVGGAPVLDIPSAGAFQNDWMFRSQADVRYLKQVGDDAQVSVGYGYYQNLHADVKTLDLFSHTITAQYVRQLDDYWTSALNYSFAHYDVDHRSLVSQNNVSYGLAYRPNNQWSYEMLANFTDSNFRGIDSLDARFWSSKTSVTRYLNDSQTSWISGGYQYGYWDARQDTFSYDLHSVFVSWRKALNREATTTLDLGGSYGNYGFRGIDFIQRDRRRDDDLFSISATISRQLNDRWTIFAAYIYTDSESNVVRQDYAANFFSSGLTLTY